jgi:hypothetical protein
LGYFLKPKQFNLTNYLVGIRHLKLLKSDFDGGRFNVGYANLMLKMTMHLVTVQQPKSFLKFCVKQPVAQLLQNCLTFYGT